jgi:peptidoglycan/LPS O-acetylase OafA/YrhL
MDVTSTGYRRDIDGLRAVAIIFVVLFHAFPEIPNGGFVGVDVFFVISGYLISGILMNNLRAGQFSLLGFYARRCRRIMPALIVVLAFVLVAGWYLLLPAEYAAAGWGVLGGAAFVSNILLWNQTGYFDTAAAVKPLLHLWSLGIEEQFYLIWPLLLWAAYRTRLSLGWSIGVLLAVSFATMLASPQTQAFYFLPPRFWELLLGGGLAYLEHYRPIRLDALLSRSPFRAAGIGPTGGIETLKGLVAVALLAWSWLALGADTDFPSWNALAPTLAAALLLSTGGRGWVNRTVLASSPAVFVGRISYPLYLWHWPLLSFAHIIVGATPPLEVRIALVMLAVALATLTWLLVERPSQRLLPSALLDGRKRGAVGLVAASVAMLAIFGGAGAVIDLKDGMPRRVKQGILGAGEATPAYFYAFESKMKSWNGLCGHIPKQPTEWCHANNPERVSFALYGDSHAEHYLPGLLGPQTASDGWLFVGHSACPPVMNIDVREGDTDTHCDENNAWAQAVLASRSDIKTVVLSSLMTPYVHDTRSSHYSRDGAFKLRSKAYDGSLMDIYFQGLEDSVTKLLSAGKRVIVMIDTPELPFDLSRCFGKRPLQLLLARAKTLPCMVSRAEYEQRNLHTRQMIATLKKAHPQILIYDPAAVFCDKIWCHVLHDGQSLYRDNDHLSVYGSRWAGAHFLRWMSQQGIPLSSEARDYANSVD